MIYGQDFTKELIKRHNRKLHAKLALQNQDKLENFTKAAGAEQRPDDPYEKDSRFNQISFYPVNKATVPIT